MFVLVNVLLLGAALGGTLNLGLALAGPAESRTQRLKALWSEERWLFGGWGGGLRSEAGGWLFLAAVAIFQYQAVFTNSLIRTVTPVFHEWWGMVLDTVVWCLLGTKILLCTKVSFKQLVSAGAVFFILRWVFLNCHNLWFIMSVCVMLAAKDVPLRRVLKVCFAVTVVSIATVNLLAVAKLIPTVLMEGGARPRNSFGYGWPNLLGAYVLGAALMYVCLRQKRFKWYDFGLVLALAFYMDRGPDSRAATVCLLLLTVLLAVLRLWPALFRQVWLRWVLAAAPFLAFAASYWMQWAYDPANPLLYKLNEMLSGRLRLGHEAIGLVPARILGQMPAVEIIVDNFYLNWWLIGGPIASLLLWLGFSVLLFRLLKNGHPAEAVCCLVMLAHGFMEQHVIWSCVNITIWLLCGVVYLLPDGRFPSFAPLPTEKEKENA